ncbi:MAG: methionine adenosyltransferase [bacterium]|nr:methionine adenosyltransferase [bacterium]
MVGQSNASTAALNQKENGVPDNRDHLFTSESVSMGHPDKVADQISDAILDSLLEHDPQARCAVETLVTTGLVVIAGEVTVHNAAAESALGRVEETTRATIRRIGYTEAGVGFDADSCAVLRALHAQSGDISQGVTEGQGLHAEQGAGDQGLMFGYACDETAALMPLPIHLSHRILERLAEAREKEEITWIRPDSKSQVTVRYSDGRPVAIDTIVVSTQHTEDVVDGSGNMTAEARSEIEDKVIKPVVEAECKHLLSGDIEYLINPTGRFVIGGPHGDSGLTGRKIIVDTYGGRGRHGGGAFSGKDPSKVDRSATYMARYIAKNIVAAGLASEAEVQLAYAIGVADPVSVYVDTLGTGRVSEAKLEAAVRKVFPLSPRGIIEHLDLRRPIYQETARNGHFGRELPEFTWERTDRIDELKAAAGTAEVAV